MHHHWKMVFEWLVVYLSIALPHPREMMTCSFYVWESQFLDTMYLIFWTLNQKVVSTEKIWNKKAVCCLFRNFVTDGKAHKHGTLSILPFLIC